MKKFTLLLVAAVVCIQCSSRKEKIPPISMESSSSKVIIYQLMVRLFGNKQTTHKPFGTIHENGVGKFNDVDDVALKAIKGMGVTHIWLTGVIEHATLSDNTRYGIPLDDADIVKGRAGSPYAIKDYYDVDPDLAVDVLNRMKEFEQLVDRTHKQDLKVLIDFVPNHVARAYKSDSKPKNTKDLGEDDDKSFSFNPKNNFYYLLGQSFKPPTDFSPLGRGNGFPTLDKKFEETPARATGNDLFVATPGANDWFETIKLNYGIDIQNNRKTHFDPIPDTWIKMRDILLFWASKNVDGFRCDMAEMVPVEFWNWVIPQVKAVSPDIIFVAEIYNSSEYKNYLEIGRFNYLYDKVELYDKLRMLLEGKGSTSDIVAISRSHADIDKHLLHFMENHDEQRIGSKHFMGDPWKALPAMVVSATLDRGPVMIYFGQEVGESAQDAEGFSGDDGRTSIFDYWGVPEHQKWMNNGAFDGNALSGEQKQLRTFYAELLNLAHKNIAITEGEFVDLTEANMKAGNFNDKVLAYLRVRDNEKLLVLASFENKDLTIKVTIPSPAAQMAGLDSKLSYIARDLLLERVDIVLENELTFELSIKPYSAYVFKIK